MLLDLVDETVLPPNALILTFLNNILDYSVNLIKWYILRQWYYTRHDDQSN